MARAGQAIENPATGERIEFRKTAEDTTGESLEFDYYLRPGGFAVGRVDHVHPRQEERIEVRSGRLGVRIDGDEWTATPGTSFAVLPGVAHTVWNDGDDGMHATIEIRPALDTETFFETTCGLARDGKTLRWGLPTPLRFAVLADAFREEFALGGVPIPVQRGLVGALAALGRSLGHRARYARSEHADGVARDGDPVREEVVAAEPDWLRR
jgi:mannose-6-phosphate isomerase-like protein (cupin superfamily)